MWALVWHQVRDYETWREVYDADEPRRQRYGCRRAYVYRSTDDPNDVLVALEMPDRRAADSFFADPGLAEAMRRGGVVKTPTFSYSERVLLPA